LGLEMVEGGNQFGVRRAIVSRVRIWLELPTLPGNTSRVVETIRIDVWVSHGSWWLLAVGYGERLFERKTTSVETLAQDCAFEAKLHQGV